MFIETFIVIFNHFIQKISNPENKQAFSHADITVIVILPAILVFYEKCDNELK